MRKKASHSPDQAREERRLKRQAILERRSQKEARSDQKQTRTDQKLTSPKTKGKKRVSARSARRRTLLFVFLIIVLSLAGISAYRIYDLKVQETKALKLQQELEAQKARLQQELTRTNDPEYIEEQAREQLKMVNPGEVLYVIPKESEPESSQNTTKSGILP